MTPEQEAAVARQSASTQRYERTKKAHGQAREDARADALASLRAGVPPAVVARSSPFTDAYIRTIAREAGIKGDPRFLRGGVVPRRDP